MPKVKLYSLESAILRDCVHLKEKKCSPKLSKKSEDFFVYNTGDDCSDFFKENPLVFEADIDVTSKNISVVDYLSGPSIPVFSARFVETLQDKLKDDLEFYPCKVICEDVQYDFFAGRILKFLPIESTVEKQGNQEEDSQAQNALDSTELSESDFFIARDEEWEVIYRVSEALKELIEEHGMVIRLDEYPW